MHTTNTKVITTQFNRVIEITEHNNLFNVSDDLSDGLDNLSNYASTDEEMYEYSPVFNIDEYTIYLLWQSSYSQTFYGKRIHIPLYSILE